MQLKTIKRKQGDFEGIFSYVPNEYNYSMDYVVLYKGHVLSNGSSTSNFEQKPSDESLDRKMEEAVNKLNSRKKYLGIEEPEQV